MEAGTVVFVVFAVFLYFCSPVLTAVKELLETRWQLRKLYPSPPYHWWYGHSRVTGLNHNLLMQLIDWMKDYPTCFALFRGPLRSILFVCHPSTVKDILRVSEHKYYGPGPSFYSFSRPIIGDGLLNSGGQKWFRNRRLLTPAFHFGILKNYMKVFNETALTFCENLTSNPDAKTGVEIFRAVSFCTMETLLRCAFSSDGKLPIEGGNANFFKVTDELIHIMARRITSLWMYPDLIFYNTRLGQEFRAKCTLLNDAALKIIRKRRQDLSSQPEAGKEYQDFLDILLLAEDEDGNKLTEQEIADEARTFLFAGYDTTECALGFLFYNLAKCPNYQCMARQEVDSFMEDSSTNTMAVNDLARLPFLAQCVKESLRMFPPANFTHRKTSRALTVDGKSVPLNTWVSVSLWALHHNPAVWGDDHMEFKPERFSEENIKTMDSHAFTPFSAGPRNCIGQNFALNEIKVFAAHVLRQFEFELHDSTKLDLVYEAVLKNRNGIKLCFTKRAL